jgi:hypothetical protein
MDCRTLSKLSNSAFCCFELNPGREGQSILATVAIHTPRISVRANGIAVLCCSTERDGRNGYHEDESEQESHIADLG